MGGIPVGKKSLTTSGQLATHTDYLWKHRGVDDSPPGCSPDSNPACSLGLSTHSLPSVQLSTIPGRDRAWEVPGRQLKCADTELVHPFNNSQ